MTAAPRLRSALLVLLAALLLPVGLVLSASSASAHTQLASSSPADGEQLAAAPSAVVLTFTEDVLALGTEVVVTGPAGPVAVTDLAVEGTTVTAQLDATGGAGEHTVDWRVTAGDGHPISGSSTYAVAEAAAAAPAEEPAAAAEEPAAEPPAEERDAEASAAIASDAAADAGGTVPVIAWVVVAAVVLVAAGGIVSRTRRHRV